VPVSISAHSKGLGGGMNYSVVHKIRGSSECAKIMDAFAPKLAAQRLFYRTLLRMWLRATNPVWFVRKRRG